MTMLLDPLLIGVCAVGFVASDFGFALVRRARARAKAAAEEAARLRAEETRADEHEWDQRYARQKASFDQRMALQRDEQRQVLGLPPMVKPENPAWIAAEAARTKRDTTDEELIKSFLSVHGLSSLSTIRLGMKEETRGAHDWIRKDEPEILSALSALEATGAIRRRPHFGSYQYELHARETPIQRPVPSARERELIGELKTLKAKLSAAQPPRVEPTIWIVRDIHDGRIDSVWPSEVAAVLRAEQSVAFAVEPCATGVMGNNTLQPSPSLPRPVPSETWAQCTSGPPDWLGCTSNAPPRGRQVTLEEILGRSRRR